MSRRAPSPWLVFVFTAAATGQAPAPMEPPPARLTVGVVAAKADAATGPLLEQLRGAGMQVRHLEPAVCAPEPLRTVDVVVVHWPADRPVDGATPLGPVARWDRPTVLLGTAGERFAARWGQPDAAAMAAMPANARGPEMQEMTRPAGASTVVWRQGHLFHFADGAPATWSAAEGGWFVATVQSAARFVSDRPVWRHPTASGDARPEAEQQRQQRIEHACAHFAITAGDSAALFGLPDRFDGRDRDRAAQLLVDLLPDGKDGIASKNTWKSWLQVHESALVWDPLSSTWRLDWLAFWRGVPSAELRGDARADGGERQPAAVELAAKVVQRHGGAALADLATFTCWLGSVHYTWDRRRGLFRMESHVAIPPGARATSWAVSVFDAAADEQLIWGGGPAPRPRVGARAVIRELMEQMFLPALLLEPGTSLRRVPEHDGEGTQAISVRIAGRCADLEAEHVLLVTPATGDVVEVRRFTRGRLQKTFRIAATMACGPLVLPSRFVEVGRTRNREFAYDEPKWNPDVPATLATATERLTQPRDR